MPVTAFSIAPRAVMMGAVAGGIAAMADFRHTAGHMAYMLEKQRHRAAADRRNAGRGQ